MIRVAIIGGGPRGLWASEELLGLARERAVDVDLHVFDDARGVAYADDLPDDWLVNVRSSLIRTQLGGFDDWRGEHDDPFPSRRAVGEFLAASWTALEEHVPMGCALTRHDAHISSLEPDGEGWRVEGGTFDEVLLATGHAHDWPGALQGNDLPEGVRLISSPYPPANLEGIGPDDRVLVRGAALTFIDITRACEPAVFIPVTRTGQLMTVKPDLGDLDVSDLLEEGKEQIRRVADLPALVAVLADTSVRLQELAGRDDDSWGMGIAWRDMYPAIVERASYAGRDSLEGFGELAREMERVAFGPPPESADYLQNLIDTGRVDISHLGRGGEPLKDLVRELDITVVIDGVIPPPGVVPGTLVAQLVDAGHARIRPGTRGLDVEPDGTVVGQHHVAAVGRMTEDVVLGNDTLSRTLHDVIPRWARRVVSGPDQVHGIPPLTARLEPWAADLVADPAACRGLIGEFGSPVNVLHSGSMPRNINELVDAGAQMGVDTRIFFARKANKGLTFVDAVRDAGHGVDVASEHELTQVLGRGVPGDRIILSAAIKPDRLLELAIANGVVISADSRAELDRIATLAGDRVALVAPRVAPDPATLPPTRFGERTGDWARHLAAPVTGVEIVGLHVHLHGYGAADRATALRECCALIDALTTAGHTPHFIDLGGGVPMSYIDSPGQWSRYHAARHAVLDGYADPFTWKADPLNNTYPFHQSPVRGPWLKEVLGDGVAEILTERGLRLHLEPGRSLLDGCGLILAEVAFVKTRSDGLPLVGLAMNRTQCRTTSDDYLIDPLHITDAADGEELEAYLVGAYCIEDELILRRRIRFPRGVKPGDIIGIPNTAGYFMHILESASHQIPLAKNVVWPAGELDDIDR
ncbi:Diaminopimelate decarboxylase [Corynebacterium faecale]|uniref:FAD/NAD(P)-binding protein n=1 Tax=Corynebacterium faecale TaxID=1758466 RepID=UPI0025B6213B|nr:FAD/NAD(P)-binding protein [Corynebacterium faecale]WJY92083.1 Diaminopimelate decarboxylase [Corynebacterium faecale]